MAALQVAKFHVSHPKTILMTGNEELSFTHDYFKSTVLLDQLQRLLYTKVTWFPKKFMLLIFWASTDYFHTINYNSL